MRGPEQGLAPSEEVNNEWQVKPTPAAPLPARAGQGGPAKVELVQRAGSPSSHQLGHALPYLRGKN